MNESLGSLPDQTNKNDIYLYRNTLLEMNVITENNPEDKIPT
jgi:hypothetical protein